MKHYRNPLYNAMRYSLGAGALAGMAMTAAPAFAQDQDDEDAPELERIQVTGSRIQSEVVTAAAPVAEIDAEEFNVTGTTRVEDLLNQYPQLSAIGANTAFTVNPTAGFPTASLRDLGSNRTLVLVNGHRLPPGGIRSEGRDLNTIPTALIKRVEILSGGASAVYGSDAMAGVINFILDTDFTGFSASAGYAGFQHDNDNKHMQGLQERAGFDFPSGGTGLDGEARFADLVYGSYFDGGRGHAMGWVTYRDHEELFAGERDYLNCALNNASTACGGSSTAPIPNFLILNAEAGAFGNFAHLNPDGSWSQGVGQIYNFATVNHLQRPDETWTAGASIKYEINEYARPYMDFMLADYQTAAQIAESGTFFAHGHLGQTCSSPLLGSLCSDLGLGLDPDEDVIIYVGKRNTEGGGRRSTINATNWRAVTGIEGDINANWSYDASFMFAANRSSESNENDFLTANVTGALLNCLDPDLVDTPACYNAFVPDGITEEAAAQLGGVGIRTGSNTLMVGNAFVSGDLGFGLPSAGGDTVKLVVGGEWRREEYQRISDTNMAQGNFLGLGGARPSIAGSVEVTEGFIESAVPIVAGAGALDYLGLDLAYRISDYDTSGIAHTWKIGGHANFANIVRLRGGWNRAIRSANTNELFAQQQIALFAGSDPCAGPTPEFTQAQCANTGVSADQYGNVPDNPASQYNQFTGGNPNLAPEEADTYTFGVVLTPIDGLEVAVDYWDIRMTDRIGGIGANTILRFCGLTGDPFLCDKINRRAGSGDIWVGSDVNASGFVENLADNFGDLNYNGVDLNARYRFNLLGGQMTTSLVGTYFLEQEIAPLPGVNDEATFDCAGRINTACGNVPAWRHIASVGYARDWWSVSARWRYVDKLTYKDTDDTLGTVDQMVIATGNKVGSVSFFDLTGSFRIGEHTDLTIGVNNILDREPAIVGGDLATGTLNSLGGYDQAGRYIHSRITFNF